MPNFQCVAIARNRRGNEIARSRGYAIAMVDCDGGWWPKYDTLIELSLREKCTIATLTVEDGFGSQLMRLTNGGRGFPKLPRGNMEVFIAGHDDDEEHRVAVNVQTNEFSGFRKHR